MDGMSGAGNNGSDGPKGQISFFLDIAPRRRRRHQTFRPRRERPATFGDCQRIEADRVADMRRRWLPVVEESCRHRCRYNLLVDFPRATGETCVLRLAALSMSTDEIARKVGMSEALVKNVVATGLGKLRARLPEPDDNSHHSPEHRVTRALASGPMTWAELVTAIGIDGDEADRYSEIVRGMVRRGELEAVIVDGVGLYAIGDAG